MRHSGRRTDGKRTAGPSAAGSFLAPVLMLAGLLLSGSAIAMPASSAPQDSEQSAAQNPTGVTQMRPADRSDTPAVAGESAGVAGPLPVPPPVPGPASLIHPTELIKRLGDPQDFRLMRPAEYRAWLSHITACTLAMTHPPSLTRLELHTGLDGNDLVGTACFWLHNPHPVPALFPLAPCNVAIRGPVAGGTGTVLFSHGTTLYLAVPPGRQTIRVPWSVRGTPSPEGLTFALELPECPWTVLYFQTPHDWEAMLDGAPMEKSDASVPHASFSASGIAAGRTGATVWYAALGRRKTRLELIARHTDSDAQAAFVLRSKRQFFVSGGHIASQWHWDIEPLARPLRRVDLRILGSWAPMQVQGASIDHWTWHPHGHGGTLQLFFRTPLSGRTRVQAQGKDQPFALPGRLVFPGVSAPGAVRGQDEIFLHIEPDIVPSAWDMAGYEATAFVSPGAEEAVDRSWRSLRLIRSALVPDTGTAPAVTLTIRRAEMRASVLAYCTWPAPAPELQATVTWQVLDGQVFFLPVILPSGWAVQDVHIADGLGPDSGRTVWLQDWYVQSADTGAARLVLELARPAGTGAVLRAVLHLRPESTHKTVLATSQLPVPWIWPENVTSFDGTLFVRPDPMDQPDLATRLVYDPAGSQRHVQATVAPRDGLRLTYHGRVSGGYIRLQSVPARARLACQIVPSGVALQADTTLELIAPPSLPVEWIFDDPLELLDPSGARSAAIVCQREGRLLRIRKEAGADRSAYLRSRRTIGSCVPVLPVPYDPTTAWAAIASPLAIALPRPVTGTDMDYRLTCKSDIWATWQLLFPEAAQIQATGDELQATWSWQQAAPRSSLVWLCRSAAALRWLTPPYVLGHLELSGDAHYVWQGLVQAPAGWLAFSLPADCVLEGVWIDRCPTTCELVGTVWRAFVGTQARQVTIAYRMHTATGPGLWIARLRMPHWLNLSDAPTPDIYWAIPREFEPLGLADWTLLDSVAVPQNHFLPAPETLATYRLYRTPSGLSALFVHKATVFGLTLAAVAMTVLIGSSRDLRLRSIRLVVLLATGSGIGLWTENALQALGTGVALTAGVLLAWQVAVHARDMRSQVLPPAAAIFLAVSMLWPARVRAESPDARNQPGVLYVPGWLPGHNLFAVPADLYKHWSEWLERYPIAAPIVREAVYQLTVEDERATCMVQLKVQVPARSATLRKDSELRIPIGSGRLETIEVNDRAEFARSEKEGISIALDQSGEHYVRLRYVLALGQVDGFGALQVAAMPSPVTRVRVRFSKPVVWAQIANGRGQQKIRHTDKESILEADLGTVGEMRILWAMPAPARPVAEQVALWTVSDRAMSLEAVLLVDPGGQPFQHIAWRLPRGAEVVRVAVEPTASAREVPVRLRTWHVENASGARRLHVYLRAPATAPLELYVALALRPDFLRGEQALAALESLPSLGLPKIGPILWAWCSRTGTYLLLTDSPQPEGLSLARSVLALRLDGWDFVPPDRPGLSVIRGVPSDLVGLPYVRRWLPALFASGPTWVFVVSGAADVPGLVALRKPKQQPAGQQDWEVHVRPGELLFTARLVLDGSPPHALLEATLPEGSVISRVTGPVDHWHQQGRRLSLYLSEVSGQRAQLAIQGTMPVNVRDRAGVLGLPRLDLAGVSFTRSSVRIRTNELVEIVKVDAPNWEIHPATGERSGMLHLETTRGGAPAQLTVRIVERPTSEKTPEGASVAPAARVEYVAALCDTRFQAERTAWHDIKIFLHHTGGARLRMDLARDLRLQTLELDGQSWPHFHVRQHERGWELHVSMPSEAACRCLRLLATETLAEGESWHPPQIPAVPVGLWTIKAHTHDTASAAPARERVAARLRVAQALLQGCQARASTSSAGLLQASRALSDLLAASAGLLTAIPEPERSALHSQATELGRRHLEWLARYPQIADEIRERAERTQRALGALDSERLAPVDDEIVWLVGEPIPVLRVNQPTSRPSDRTATLGSVLLMAGTVLLFMVVRRRTALSRLAWAAPEAIFLLGLWSWVFAGGRWVGAGLCLWGLGLRIEDLYHKYLRPVRRRPAFAPPGTSESEVRSSVRL